MLVFPSIKIYTMTELQTASGRPRRQAAENALYKPCPACEKKFLVTEIEFHANLCIMKLERQQTAKSSPTKTVRTSPKSPAKKEPPQNKKIKEIRSKAIFKKVRQKILLSLQIFFQLELTFFSSSCVKF